MTRTTTVMRPARDEDDGFIASLVTSVLSEPFVAAGLPPALVEAMVATQVVAQQSGYQSTYPAARTFIIEEAGESVGRVIVEYRTDQHRVVDIAIASSRRGSGCGSRILDRLKDEARQQQCPLRASVAESNEGSYRWFCANGFVLVAEEPPHRHIEWRPS